MDKKIKVPDVHIPCDACLDDPNFTFSDGSFITTYCRHTSTGGLLDIRPGSPLQNVWRIMSGIEEEVFALFVKQRTENATNVLHVSSSKKSLAKWN